MEERVLHPRRQNRLFDRAFGGVILERSECRMNDGRKNEPAHPSPLRGFDHALADARFVGKERWRDIEDRVDSVERGVHAGTVLKIADGHVRGAVRPHPFCVRRSSYKSADLGATLGKRRKHEPGKFAGRSDREDRRLCLLHRRPNQSALELAAGRLRRVFGLRIEGDRRTRRGLVDDIHHGFK